MYPTILHIYGPLTIQSYGLCICLGIITYIFCTKSLLVPTYIDEDTYLSLLLYGISSGILGGRLLYVFCHPEFFTDPLTIIALWDGGFSILGSIIAIACTASWYIRFNTLPACFILDRCVLFAPLLQSISRIGCLLSGCCWGKNCQSWFAITYFHASVPCPSGVSMHPTQLYSTGVLLCIFIILYRYRNILFNHPGSMMCSYLFSVAAERFFVDFWRGEREFFSVQGYAIQVLSINQWVAVCLMIIAPVIYYFIISYRYESICTHQKSSFHS